MKSASASTVRFKLFAPGNPKIAKGERYGIWTVVLHLAPGRLSGFETCPKRTVGCTMACLNLAGRGGIAAGGLLSHEEVATGSRRNAVQEARIRKTQLFFNDREAFMALLVKDIQKAKKISRRDGLKLAIRLNGTSDIRWESVRTNSTSGLSVMELFPHTQFYDYTKIANRKNVPSNYALTFSLADGNDAEAAKALRNGINVAAVFRNRAAVESYLETGFTIDNQTFTCIDGDDSDLRFMDPRAAIGFVVSLYAKGPAKKDTSGFVRDVPAPLLQTIAASKSRIWR